MLCACATDINTDADDSTKYWFLVLDVINSRAIGLKGLGGLQPPQGKINQLVGMKIEPLSAQE